MIIVTENPIDAVKMFELLDKKNSGSALFHYAVVKNLAGDRPSSGILFEKNGDMDGELSRIESEIRKSRDINDILLVRRTGLLHVGDIISLVAVSSTASADAFAACSNGLDMIRQMKTVKKTELYTDI